MLGCSCSDSNSLCWLVNYLLNVVMGSFVQKETTTKKCQTLGLTRSTIQIVPLYFISFVSAPC